MKSLTGKDTIPTEAKGKDERFDIVGEFNVIITGNSDIQISIDSDNGAWDRRILWIRYECPPVKEKIPDFDDILIDEEGSGILNWALEGAVKLLKNGGKIPRTAEHTRRVEELLQESDSVNAFVEQCLVKKAGSAVTSEELYWAYEKFCRQQDWIPKSEYKAKSGFRSAILAKFKVSRSNIHNGTRKGYEGIGIR